MNSPYTWHQLPSSLGLPLFWHCTPELSCSCHRADCELYHTVLWGRGQVTKRLSAYMVRNRSNPSEDCRVPSCAQLKTSAPTLPPRSIRMVSPKSCSQVTRQLGGMSRPEMLGVHSYPKWLQGGYSPRPSRKSGQTYWFSTKIHEGF